MADGLNDSYASGSFAAVDPPAAGKQEPPDPEEDFSRFFREQAPNVRRFLLRRRLSPQAADDLVQEVFLRAYRAFPGFTKRGIPAAEAKWAATIALRLWHNSYRDNRSEPILALDLEEEGGLFDPIDSKAVDNRRRVIAIELVAAIPRLVRQLPTGQREVLDLWLKGNSYDGICRQTGKSLQNVRATLHKARSKLGESLRQLDDVRPRGGENH